MTATKMDNVELWWFFRERRNDAQALYLKTGDVQYLTQSKYLQGLMDDCYKDIQQNK